MIPWFNSKYNHDGILMSSNVISVDSSSREHKLDFHEHKLTIDYNTNTGSRELHYDIEKNKFDVLYRGFKDLLIHRCFTIIFYFYNYSPYQSLM